MADYTLEQLQIEEYDSLLITGCNNAKETIEDAKTLEFIDGFYNAGALILLFLLLRYFY